MREISTILMVMIVVFTVGYIIHSFRMMFPSRKARVAQEAKWREEDLIEIETLTLLTALETRITVTGEKILEMYKESEIKENDK